LAAISNAKPQVASFPFTTLTPNLGVVQCAPLHCATATFIASFIFFYSRRFEDTQSLTVADLPGIIEGAHANRGLGHLFLRHIERTRVLMFVLDTAGVDGRNCLSDLTVLLQELEACVRPLSFCYLLKERHLKAWLQVQARSVCEAVHCRCQQE
jgi:GTP-binding protein